MTVYNKLKIAILAILASQHIHAITIDPVQIQSAPGELLYAEINFRQSDPSLPLQASLASAEDLIAIGAGHQPPGHLNFFTRRDSSGKGVITITSSRPITDAELNIVVKITEGNAMRMQHIKTPLKRSAQSNAAVNLSRNERPLAPVMVVNEKDIALNLPVSTQYASALPKPAVSAVKNNEIPLSISKAPPPSMNSAPALSTAPVPAPAPMTAQRAPLPAPVIAIPAPAAEAPVPKPAIPAPAAIKAQPAVQAQQKPAPKAETPYKEQPRAAAPSPAPASTHSTDPLVKKFTEEAAAKQQAPALKAQNTAPPQPAVNAQALPPAEPVAKPQYVVQSNETLWGIASRIAAEQRKPIAEVMKQIKASNEHAFVKGDANRLRQGAALNLNAAVSPKTQTKVSASELAKVPSAQSGKAKYRLNQAEMSLISENEQDSARTSANKNTEKNQTSDKLSLKIMTSREKTVKLQRNVTQLELALNQKDHRIQLLNARLAQLEEKLKAQRAAKKPIH